MLIYTFRTFPQTDQLAARFGDVFVFSKLKDDLQILEQRITAERPDYVLGLAAAHHQTRFEPRAINQFNRGVIIRDGRPELPLHIPECAHDFTVAAAPTHTFCNWTMYRLQSFIIQNGLGAKLVFVHLNAGDLNRIADALQ